MFSVLSSFGHFVSLVSKLPCFVSSPSFVAYDYAVVDDLVAVIEHDVVGSHCDAYYFCMIRRRVLVVAKLKALVVGHIVQSCCCS
jgi:hypothetical protein